MKTYTVKEIFKSIQGEGFHSGRVAVFVRFSGCNAWSGAESDRALSCSAWCDTDFVGTDGDNGGKYGVLDMIARVADLWGQDRHRRFVVLTGGEPTLQIDNILINSFQRFGFKVAVETNGSRPVPDAADWITVSPKVGIPIVQKSGSELKLAYPQDGMTPSEFDSLDFVHWFIQPIDGNCIDDNKKISVQFCIDNPKWRLSLQTHKILGLR